VVFRSNDTRVVRARLRAAAGAVPTGRVGTVRAGGGVTYADVDTTLDLKDAKGYTDALRRAVAGRPAAYVTGQPALQRDLDPILAGDLRRGEALAVPVAVLVVLSLFGLTLAAAIPFLFA